MEETRHLMDFWYVGTTHCVLVSVDYGLELRLYDREDLVGLHPCRDAFEALTVSRQWRAEPPTWPPF